MENKINIISTSNENPAAMQLRLAMREVSKKDSTIVPNNWYKTSFMFNIDEQNMVTVNDIKIEKCVDVSVKSQEPDSDTVDLRDWVREYDAVMEENKRLNNSNKVSKTIDEAKRSVTSFWNNNVMER